MKYIKTIGIAVCAATLAACTGSRVSQNEAASFQGGVEEFLAAQFSARWFESDLQNRDRYEGKGIRYRGYGTTLNTGYITKPRDDLATFCRAKGGTFSRMALADFNQQLADAEARRRGETRARADTIDALARADLIARGYPQRDIDLVMATTYERRYQQTAMTGNATKAAQQLRQLEQEGAFGHFVCKKRNEGSSYASFRSG